MTQDLATGFIAYFLAFGLGRVSTEALEIGIALSQSSMSMIWVCFRSRLGNLGE